MKIAVFGSLGFLGKAISDGLPGAICITRSNYNQYIGEHFDIFINAAGNKKSFWANNFPYDDFQYSTAVVYKTISNFQIDKYIFISSIAVYDKNNKYGFNKLLSEQIIQNNIKENLIIRACNIIDKSLDIGVISDIEKNIPLFLTKDSKIQFITRDGFVSIFNKLLLRHFGVIDVGGLGSVSISQIENILNKKAIIASDAKYRHYEMDISALLNIMTVKSSEEYIKDYNAS